jgi:hypothetical protein
MAARQKFLCALARFGAGAESPLSFLALTPFPPSLFGIPAGMKTLPHSWHPRRWTLYKNEARSRDH